MKMKDKLMHGVLPAMLMAISVGQIYAFTNFSGDITSFVGSTEKTIQLAFSLGIFFLGMGAAFFGKLVEKSVKKSAAVGTSLFILGLLIAQTGVCVRNPALVLIGYGVFLGLGTGIIYLTPVKTLMMWFPEKKALASAVPIIFFGLGSTLATFLYKLFIGFGIERLLLFMAITYLPMMIVGGLLLKKPDVEQSIACGSATFRYKKLMSTKFFWSSWLFMLMNISAGLSLIPLAKRIMANELAFQENAMMTFIALAGVFNGAGRLVFAWWADKLRNRADIILAILGGSVLAIGILFLSPPVFGVSLLVINACYGAGFSVIPSILSDRFGMSDISKIHGAVLSAWGVAGLIGNNVSIRVIDSFGFTGLISMLTGLYLVNLLLNWPIMRHELKAMKTKVPR